MESCSLDSFFLFFVLIIHRLRAQIKENEKPFSGANKIQQNFKLSQSNQRKAKKKKKNNLKINHLLNQLRYCE